MIKNNINIDDVLQIKWESHKFVNDGDFTKTTQFMFPSLEISINIDFVNSFVNAFIDDVEYEHVFTRPLFLLFKITKDWKAVNKQLLSNKNYILDYNVGKKDGVDCVMFIFEVPEKFKNDYYNFKQSKYSCFSEEYKKKFPKHISYKNTKKEAVVWQIINKSESLKRTLEQEIGLDEGFLDNQDEIWDKLNKKTEIYNFKN